MKKLIKLKSPFRKNRMYSYICCLLHFVMRPNIMFSSDASKGSNASKQFFTVSLSISRDLV